MVVLTYLLPALAVATFAAAQCSTSATATIQNQGDASAIAGCSTFSGSIAIATGTTGGIALDGIQEITGSLYANNVTQMNSLSANNLQKIDDTFYLNGITILTTLNFPQLSNVKTIDWTALPNLQQLSFTSQVKTAQSVSIVNTQLYSLQGINLQTVQSMTVTNNNFLNTVNMQLANITQSLTLGANGKNVTASFPNLITAQNITFRNVSQVNIPSLASLGGSMGFYSNFMSSVSAPNLTSVNQSLAFVDNANLTSIDMPELTSVKGALQAANNTALDTIAFPALQNIGGALDFNGNFTNVTLPSLKNVAGAFNLQSSADISNICNYFQPLSGQSNVIKGTYTCAGSQSHPGGTGTLPAGTNSGSGNGTSSGGKKSAAATLSLPTVTSATVVLGLIAAVFGML